MSCSSVLSPWSPCAAGTQAKVSSTVSMGERVTANSPHQTDSNLFFICEQKTEQFLFDFHAVLSSV